MATDILLTCHYAATFNRNIQVCRTNIKHCSYLLSNFLSSYKPYFFKLFIHPLGIVHMLHVHGARSPTSEE
jgi:hypothetical protein